MKISKKILFSTFLIIGISSSVVFASSGKVKIEATRIREEANTTSNIITVIYENDEVEILEESGDWYKIKYKDSTGYVKKEFITVDSSSSNTTSTTNQDDSQNNTAITDQGDQSSVVITSETYAKLLPSFSSVNVVKFEVSKQLTKLSEINNWIQVSDGQNTGWILKNKTQAESKQVVKEENQNTSVENEVTNTVANVSNTVSNTTNSSTNNVTNTTTNTSSNTTNTSSSGATVNKKATVTVETAKVREKATTDSEVLGFLDYGDEITLLEQTGDWYKINFESKTGYIKNTLIKVSDETVSSRSLTEEREDYNESQETAQATASSSDVVNYAMQYLGYPYVVGGKSPTTGFDCSGFTRYVFLNFGYSLGSTAASQNNVGDEVSRSDLEPGDLILFLNEAKTGIGHTGIYIGDGNFIHAANPDRGVVTDNLNTNSYYNERFVTARRIVK